MDKSTFQRVMALSKGEQMAYDPSKTWIDLFAEQARLHPDRAAVVAENGTLTYGALDELSNRLAAALIESEGVRPGDFVAVRMGRVKEFHAAVLAIHRAGAAYMPIDLEYPADRVDYMMADSGAKLTLTEERFEALLSKAAKADAVNRCSPERRAYMIYTSGSTGKPKGVVILQRGLTNLVRFIARRWGLNENSRISLHSNFAFDAAVEDLFPALTVGGTVFVVPERARKDIYEMRDFIAQNRINGGCYSTQFGQLLGADAPIDVDYVCLGGEAMTSVPQCRGKVYNTYGPTEFTVDATYFELEKGADYRTIPIGRPLDNCAAYIVNDRLELLPPGETGELCLAGPQLAEGYWNRPDLTEKAFTKLKLSADETVDIYRTGDLARWNDDGALEFCGRIDTQVKLRGFRVELGEVESCAARFPGIQQVAAEVRRNTLCLYYTAAGEIDEAELSKHMAASLADYMVPGAFVRLNDMPHNVNGKIDRKALPDPVIGAGADYVAPETDAERAVADAMAKVLGSAEPIGVEHDFFELGGDSIKAIRLVSLLRQAGYAVSVADVMQARAARALAKRLSASGGEAISQAPFEGAVEDTAIFAFFKDLNYPNPAYFNQSTLLQWRGRASLDALQRASDAITAQHDMLRAVIKDGHLFVRPADAAIKIEEYTVPDDTDAIRAKCEDIQSHLYVEEALVRQALIHAGGRDLFFLTAHHTIVDGVSWRVWLDDLETAYGQAAKGEPVRLPAKTHTYRDYAEAMKAYRSGYALSLEIPYWKGVEAKLLALDTSANKDYARQFKQLNVEMSASDTEAFRRAKLNVLRLEVNDLLLAALGQGFREAFGKDAVSINLEGHGREDLGRPLSVDRAIGWFTSVYPVVLEGFTGDAEGDLIRVKETLRAVPNKGVGYNILAFVEGSPETHFQTERAPMVTFNYLGDVSGERENGQYFEPDSADGFSAGLDYYDPRNHDGSDLVINCLIDGGRFSLWLDYNAGRFKEEQARAFAETVLKRITALGGFLNAQAKPLPPTASDLGETEWSPEEFNAIAAEFAARGEALERIYPLTPMQEGMLLEHVSHPESLAYRLIDIYKCDRALDEARLRHAVDALAERHEALRTAIIHKGVRAFRQAVVDRKLPVTVVDAPEGEDPFEAAKKIRLDILKNGYDLQERPLTQFVYVRSAQGGCLVFATHHIITDGWCFETIIRDLNALLRGEPPEGAGNEPYEKAVRELLKRDRAAAVSHFAEVLKGYENSASVPSYGGVPEAERSAEDQYRGTLSPEDAGRLSELCKSAGATLADGFSLAWGLTLRTINRLSDVAFITIASGRDGYSFDVSDIVGLFINPVAVRVNPAADATARQALAQMHQQAVEGKPFDFCPLADVQRAVGADAKLNGFTISFENYSETGEAWTPLSPAFAREEHGTGETAVDATVMANGGVSVLLSYDPAYNRRAEIERLFGLFLNYARRMADAPDMPLSKLPHLSDADRDAALALSQGEKLDYDASKTWVDLFKEQAAQHPDRTAVVADNGSFTYGELDRLSDRLAARLVASGVEKDAFVGVRMGRVREFHLAVLAIQKAGAAYMPIDMEYPEERAQYMLSDSGAKLLLNEDNAAELLKAGEDAPFKPLCGPDSRAYMIYTSGSTGKPKGVAIQHKALLNFVHDVARRYGLSEKSRIAVHPNFAFDASVESLYPALTAGGTVFIVPESARRDILEMRDYIAQNGISGGVCSTQFGQLLGADAELPMDYITIGGEAMTNPPKCRGRVFNAYGPTEFTVAATFYEVEKGRTYRTIPIGRPMDNCAAYILDAEGRPLPRGVTGELCLSGPQLAEGYWNRPDLTAKAFTDVELSPGQTEKVYRTGDLARYDEDDQLEFCGRIDFQVKLRGFRIELGEIENVAAACPGVRMAAAEVKNQMLCLYYTEKAGETVDADALSEQLARKLADYMVPGAFIRLDEMPMTVNGKVNRKALPEPQRTESGKAVEPETDTERRLYDAAKEILGADGFGVEGDLTLLGLTSISAMRLSAAIEHTFKRRVTVSDILHAPTVRALAKQIDGGAGDDHAYEKRDSYPLSMTQMGIFTECMRYAGTTVYNIPYLCKLDDKIDMDRLRGALEKAVLAHPYLSMTLEKTEGGEVRAARHAPERIEIPVLKEMPPEDALVRPFDLASGGALCRFELYDAPKGKYLFMDIHHIVADGASYRILLDDINAAYAGNAVAPETYTGFEFALDEQKARASERFAAAKAWYDGVLKGCASETLPLRETDRTSYRKIATGRRYGETGADAVRAYCKARGLTPNAFFTAAFALAMKAYTGSESAVFCCIYNGRSDPRLERSVSMFVKTLPVALDCAADSAVADAVSACQSYLLNAMSNDIYSFAEIKETYGIEADALFAYQGERAEGVSIGGLPAENVNLTVSQATAAFGVDVSLDGKKVLYETEYDPSMYGPYTMDGFIGVLDRVCGEMLNKDKLGDIRLTGDADEAAILKLHDTDFAVAERPAYRLLQDSAKKNPERAALIAVDRRMTYAELNGEANALGRALREAGAGPETIVAVFADRDSYAYVMREGVLKSGAAFMPVDPDYPDERVEFILEDSGAKLLVAAKNALERRKSLLNALGRKGVTVIDAEEAVSGHEKGDLDVDVPGDALAYVIYTSGSTGKPKGVMLTNRNLVNFVDNNPKNRETAHYVRRGKVSLAIAALTFDVSVMEEFIPLANGMTVVLATKDQIMNPMEISSLMRYNRVDAMCCTPSYMANLVAMDAFAPALKGLRIVDLGAEAFPSALFGKLRAINPDLCIMNGYGPTEATISCTMELVEREGDTSIGIPNGNYKVATLDRDGRLQPLGAMGELTIMGAGVGRGYIGRDDLTAKSYIALMNRRAYRSGDLARICEDGRVEFHGRMDNQVKLRGLRIELGEIESVLNRYPGVKQSIVLVNQEAMCLVAYFTADGKPDIAAVKKHLSAYLAAYMVPQVIMQLKEMPLTANGKIDRWALPAPQFEKTQRAVVPPSTELQKTLCEMFQKALEIDQVGVTENFFELGGTSLKASVVLMSAMLDDLPITYQDIFDAPTVEGLEKLILERRGAQASAPAEAKGPAAEARAFNCLANNNNAHLDDLEREPLGNVLLTGATGFLGIHVLKELLERTKEKVYCLVRRHKVGPKLELSAEQMLRSTLYYYFEKTYDAMLGSRLFVLEGDITQPDSLKATLNCDYHTVINCAACVKHFAKFDFLKQINVGGVENLTALCLEKGARLIQISTVSVGGDAVGGLKEGQCLREDRLDIGQDVQSNAYVYSKYLAEKHVLECVEKKGLDAKIIRMGNLSSRERDGEFQMNFRTNAFMNSLRAYAALGCYPLTRMSDLAEISYIDEAARATVLLSGAGSQFTVFHAYNTHTVDMGNIIRAMNALGVKVEVVKNAEFGRRLQAGLADERINKYLGPLVDYTLTDDDQREEIPSQSFFTANALYHLKFAWTITDMGILRKMIKSLKTLGFFDFADGGGAEK